MEIDLPSASECVDALNSESLKNIPFSKATEVELVSIRTRNHSVSLH